MITPNDIKEQCTKWWKDILVEYILGNSSFPREINRIGKVNSKDILSKLTTYKDEINLLSANSKGSKKHGYSLVTEERIFNRIGVQIVPVRITIDSLEDYLALTKKEKEFAIFCRNWELIVGRLPILKEWIISNPQRLIEHDTWAETLKVCEYFLNNPSPNLYIRQLPIEIHTKYIEENKPLMRSLLSYLIPTKIDLKGETFEQIFHLKEKEKRIRIRFLDKTLSPLEKFTDLSFLVYELDHLNIACKYVFVAENEMNFLALPELPNTIALWSGGGFQVSYLKNIIWLKQKCFFYWGDIDAHGFQILNQFRTYFNDTTAVMMDEETFYRFKHSRGQPASNQILKTLSEAEQKLYTHVKENNLRLEQEKIDQTYADEKIRLLFKRTLHSI
ncbi:MAG: hypothetical protein KF763_13170 [Cyclobacteriaceae bacterium]|nr:hypothetical protein [Cyclobacteriaceae bacterium]